MYGSWVRAPAGSQESSPKRAVFLIFIPTLAQVATMYTSYSEKLAKYYVSTCTDLDRRLYEHNIGHSKFTSTGIPWKLVYWEDFDDLITAKSRELQIKKVKDEKQSDTFGPLLTIQGQGNQGR